MIRQSTLEQLALDAGLDLGRVVDVTITPKGATFTVISPDPLGGFGYIAKDRTRMQTHWVECPIDRHA